MMSPAPLLISHFGKYDIQESSTLINMTFVKEFVLLGFNISPTFETLLFCFFLMVYIVTVVGNIGIAALVWTDSSLHTPMYFFLSNLSSVDLCYSSAVTPKMLFIIFSEKKTISITGCAAQLFCFLTFALSDGSLLAIMAYDRYVAICNPLMYLVIMNWRLCTLLVCGAYLTGLITAATHTTCTFSLLFCKSNQINHFFCDIPPLTRLSCSDTTVVDAVVFASTTFVGAGSCAVVLASYSYIIATILRIRSAEGRRKAFSTCASHLTSVSIFYGTVFFMYLRPPSSHSDTQDKILSVFYTIIIPMLNPIIYSLRNKEVKRAVKKITCHT